jgi:hypothetical protein
MNSRPRFHDSGDEDDDTNHDRTLRALEGRTDDNALHSAPVSSSRRGAFDNEDTGDVFLKIAREESSQRQTEEQQPSDDNRSVVVSVFLLLSCLLPRHFSVALGCALCMCAQIAQVLPGSTPNSIRAHLWLDVQASNTLCFTLQC